MHVDQDLKNALKIFERLYGEKAKALLQESSRARHIDPNVPYHVISRAFQGRFLFVPDNQLNDIIKGVIGRAQTMYPCIKLYGIAVFCNHMHVMMQGPPSEFAAFLRYVKSEISRRWGFEIDWPSTMWHRYLATALPTANSQMTCFTYILAHGVKEGLTERPEQWPGVHSAVALLSGEPLAGHWLDATRYGNLRNKEKKRAERDAELDRLTREALAAGEPPPKRPRRRKARPVCKEDHLTRYEVVHTPLPAWHGLSEDDRCRRVAELVEGIVEEGRRLRNGRPVLGVEGIKALSRDRKSDLPPLPWFEDRRAMICWADPREPETQAHLTAYWEFQDAYSEASRRFRRGELTVEFPPGAFRPVTFVGLLPTDGVRHDAGAEPPGLGAGYS